MLKKGLKLFLITVLLCFIHAILQIGIEAIVVQFFGDYISVLRVYPPLGAFFGSILLHLQFIWVYLILTLIYHSYFISDKLKNNFLYLILGFSLVYISFQFIEDSNTIYAIIYFIILCVVYYLGKKINEIISFYIISMMLFFPYWYFEKYEIPLLIIYGTSLLLLSVFASKIYPIIYTSSGKPLNETGS